MENFRSEFFDFYNNLIGFLPTLSFAVLAFLIWASIGYFVVRFFEKRIRKRGHEPIFRIFIVNVFRWIFYLIGVIFALDIMGLGGVLGGVIAGASITAIVLGFAFKDIIENFLAGILLAFSSPFKSGDTIEVDGFRGRVRGLQMRTTHIRNIEGRDIYIPNSILMKSPLTNFTKDGLQRLTFTFGVDTPTDTQRVREIILEYLKTDKGVVKNPAPIVIIIKLAESSVEMRVAFWVNIFRASAADKGELGEPILSRVLGEVKELLLKNNINMPSPIVELKGYNRESPVYLKSEG